jgi:hypothetical protein
LGDGSAGANGPGQTRSAPVKLWAGFGLVSIILVVRGWIGWISSSDFTPSDPGSDPFTGVKLAVLRGCEVVSCAVALLLVYRFLIRPLLRERRLTYDGQVVLAAALLWFYDPVVNYFNFNFVYNTHFFDMGSWTFHIPGWESPNANRFPEPIFMIGGTYLWWVCGFAIAGCWIIRMLQRYRPRWSYLTMFGVVFVVMALMDLALELTTISLELWAYPGVVKSWALFPGTRHQFPLYQPLIIGLWCGGLTAIRHFRDDRGRSFAERGIEHLRLRPAQSRLLSFLAITGLMHVWMIVALFVPYGLFTMKVDTFVPMPSYMRAGICGDGTDYACPDDVVPIPDRNSLHVRPDDPQLPASVRAKQGIQPN